MSEELDIPIKNKSQVVAKRQTTSDIAKYMLIAERDSRKYHKQLRDYFQTDDDYETAKNIHQFARENLVYKKESPRKQIVRTAPRVIHDIYVDCKGYSTFILASLRACGINAWYRLAGYSRGDKIPTHVYCVAEIDGREVVIDGTVNYFDWEAPATCYYNLSLINTNKMALSYVQGIGSKASRKAKKEKRKPKKEARKEKRQEKKETRKKKIAKIGAAPARAAFILMLRTNAFKLATKLAQAIRKDRERVSRFWAKFGGNWDDLVKEVNKKSGEAAVGVVTMTAALAAATPIMIAVGTLLKEMNLFSKDEADELDEGVAEGMDIIENDPDFEKTMADVPEGEKVMKVKSSRDYQEDITPSDDADETDDEEANTMMWVIGAGALALLLMNKE